MFEASRLRLVKYPVTFNPPERKHDRYMNTLARNFGDLLHKLRSHARFASRMRQSTQAILVVGTNTKEMNLFYQKLTSDARLDEHEKIFHRSAGAESEEFLGFKRNGADDEEAGRKRPRERGCTFIFGLKSLMTGVDLPGRVIACVALRDLNAKLTIATRYGMYRLSDELKASHDLWYTWKGSIDTKQAAGRVLRTVTDEGVFVLLTGSEYKNLALLLERDAGDVKESLE